MVLVALINSGPSALALSDEKDWRNKRREKKKKKKERNAPSLNKSPGVTDTGGRLTSTMCRSIRYVELTRDRNEAPRIGY